MEHAVNLGGAAYAIELDGTRNVERAGWPNQAPVEQLRQLGEAAVEGEFVSRIELPSGGWAEIADPRKIRSKHRKRVLDQMNIDRMERRTAGIGFDMVDGLMLMMVEKWDIPYLPGVGRPLDQPASVDELTIPDYDVLSEALEPARKVIFPGPPSVDGATTPGSPTPPGGA